MRPNDETQRRAHVEQAISRAMKIDVAIGVASLAPLLFFLGKVFQDERFTLAAVTPLALLYCWTIGACYLLVIRKIQHPGLRQSIWLFSTGCFASCFVLSFTALPTLIAVGVTPIATYILTRMRAWHYSQLDLRHTLTT